MSLQRRGDDKASLVGANYYPDKWFGPKSRWLLQLTRQSLNQAGRG